MEEIRYVHRTDVHNTRAPQHFIPFVLKHISPKSVIDIGCGTGAWLNVFKTFGTEEILGVDGGNLDLSLLEIPAENFRAHDLREPLAVEKKFDLAVCLEVAEHLPASGADPLIDLLVSVSDTILFSAALPIQGGQNHLNEQPFSYWVKKFNQREYVVKDVFRNEVWEVEEIDWWYRQNTFLVVKENVAAQLPIHDFYHPGRIIAGERDMIRMTKKAKRRREKIRKYQEGNIPVKEAINILLKSVKKRVFH